MDLFNLVAKITLDTSEYEKGLDNSEKKADGFGSKLGSAVKKGSALAVAGITAVATGATIMGKCYCGLWRPSRQDVAEIGLVCRRLPKMGLCVEPCGHGH